MRVGILSDTHGFLDLSVLEALKGTDLIIHAGDIGNPDILKILRSFSRVFAVRGNMDTGPWAAKLPLTETVKIKDTLLLVLHDIHKLDFDPKKAGIHAVISGHTHRPNISNRDNVLYINPGSTSQPRGNHPPTLALLTVYVASMSVKFIELNTD